jgi:hypothetical protein
MGERRRNFLILAAWAAAAATPSFGQAVTPAAGTAGSGAQSAASIPDFSGIWSHPSFPGFEPPASGPGPVLNKVRRPQTFGTDGRRLAAANAPLVSNFNRLVGDYGSPILKPQAAEVVEKHGEISLSGATYPTPTNQCWPEPVPYILASVAIRMLQQPDKITFLYPNDHQVRYVRMNQPHPALLTPSWYGDSVGRYEGDTLVVDTVEVKTDRPFAMVDWYGTPYTRALHVVERYRLIDYEAAKEGLERDANENGFSPLGGDAGPTPDLNYRGKHLQLQFTVEDEGAFTMPWSATMTYRRGFEDWLEVVCAENAHELIFAGTAAAGPHAGKPDF